MRDDTPLCGQWFISGVTRRTSAARLVRGGLGDSKENAMATTWQPTWWNDEHFSAWDKVKEALRRDWEQTKHDLKIGTGHELRQDAKDTVKQAVGAQPIPPRDQPNPARVIGHWEEAEYPISYGYGARRQFGRDFPTWNEGIEKKLRTEWESRKDRPQSWEHTSPWVKWGYEYKPRE